MENISTEVSRKVLDMLHNRQGLEQIEADLLLRGHEPNFAKELVQECVKLHYAKRRAQGLTFILCGAVVCFSSFLLTITSSMTHFSFPLVLYGLTTAGLLLVFTGFMKVF
jgi:hypothetical protein